MVKRLSKFLSVLLVVVIFISNIAVVSYAKEDKKAYRGYETDINEIVEDLREAMTDRKPSINIKYKTNILYNNQTLQDFISDLYAKAVSVTDEADEGDYLAYITNDYGTGKTVILTEDGRDYYYTIPFYMHYYTDWLQEKVVEEKIENIIKSFNFTKDTTDKEKCDKIYRYITSTVVYDKINLNNDKYKLKFTAYAALMNGTAVCQGYATLFYRMAKECGLDTRIISGTSRGEGHAWNIVKIDGAYYYLDSTWDAGTNAYQYYLKGSGDFGEHKCDAAFETQEFKSAYPISADNYGQIHTYEKIYEDNFCVKYACKICKNEKTDSKVPMGETLAQDTDGTWYYFVDGVKNASTTLVQYNGSLCYVVNGIWDKNTKAIVQHDNKYYYINNGVWDKNYTDFLKNNNKYIYVQNGIWQHSKTGFVKDDGKYYQIKKGVRSSTDTFEKCGNAYLKISDTEYTYNGKAKKPSVKVYASNGKKLSSKYYSVSYAKGRKNVGKYKVTIKLKKKYSGTKKLYFTINPDDTSVKKVTASKKSLKVTLKKKTKQVTGYEIQYSTSKAFKSAKTKSVNGYKKTAVTLKKLKAKKTYYVRVRTYKKVGGKKYYSEWSKAKSKKTK